MVTSLTPTPGTVDYSGVLLCYNKVSDVETTTSSVETLVGLVNVVRGTYSPAFRFGKDKGQKQIELTVHWYTTGNLLIASKKHETNIYRYTCPWRRGQGQNIDDRKRNLPLKHLDDRAKIGEG